MHLLHINYLENCTYRLLSLSVLSLEFDMVEPELIENENSLIQIENGRHILLQLVAERFHPNSSYLGGESEDAKRINIIAGPNSSGKSVYLKVVSFVHDVTCVSLWLVNL